MVQVSALAECLGVRVIVEYMDGHMGPKTSSLVHHVSETNQRIVILKLVNTSAQVLLSH